MDDIQRSRYDVRPPGGHFYSGERGREVLGQITCSKSEAALAEG